MSENCLFCKIAEKKIPAKIVYEDNKTLAFLDIHPVNPGHTLVIPKSHSQDLFSIEEKDLHSVYDTVKKVATALLDTIGAEGVNIEMNNKSSAGQVIFHSHVHVIPRFSNDGLKHWGSKEYQKGQAEEIQERLKKKLQ